MSTRIPLGLVALFGAALVAGCGSSGGSNKCTGVMCPMGQICVPATGGCAPLGGGDGGSGDDLTMNGKIDLSMNGMDDLSMGGMDDLSMGGMDDLSMMMTGDMAMSGCMAAKALMFVNGKATVMGDTTNGINNTDSFNCGGVTGPDVAYTVTLNNAQELIAKVTPGDMVFDPVIYLRKTCNDDLTEVACDERGAGLAATIATILQPGTYYLWIDGYAGTKGKFTLDVTLLAPPPAPANDACMNAAPLVFANGAASVTGDARSAKDDTKSTCGAMGGLDAVYTFTTNMAQSVVATVTADMTSPNYAPVVFLRKVCASVMMGDELGCDAGSSGGTAMATVANLPAGTYWIWVDSDGGAGGKYKLDVTLGPPPPLNDNCNAAATLNFVNGVANVMFDTSNSVHDTSSAGCGGTGPDIVYTFTTNMAQQLTARVTPDVNSPNFDPIVYLRKVCADATQLNELGCDEVGPAMPASFVLPNLPAGTYFLWVDGYAGSLGKGTLNVTLAAPQLPPANDVCGGAVTLTIVNNAATTLVDTTLAVNDIQSNGCGGSGPDTVYRFTTAQMANVVATVTPDQNSQSWDPVVSVRKVCNDNTMANEVLCKETGTGLPTSVGMKALPAGTYFIWVDGAGNTKGKGRLDLTIVPPPANENCGAPQAITLNSTVMGDTRFANADMSTMVSVACDINQTGDYPGNDLSYTYTALATAMVTVTLTPDGTWDPALWVAPGACVADGSTCTAAKDGISTNLPEVITINAVQGTTYTIVVDSYDIAEAGAFTLNIK